MKQSSNLFRIMPLKNTIHEEINLSLNARSKSHSNNRKFC